MLKLNCGKEERETFWRAITQKPPLGLHYSDNLIDLSMKGTGNRNGFRTALNGSSVRGN